MPRKCHRLTNNNVVTNSEYMTFKPHVSAVVVVVDYFSLKGVVLLCWCVCRASTRSQHSAQRGVSVLLAMVLVLTQKAENLSATSFFSSSVLSFQLVKSFKYPFSPTASGGISSSCLALMAR
jgi:hypothetical protein